MRRIVETYKRLLSSEHIEEKQKKLVIRSVNRLFDTGKISENERQYILGKEE